MGCAWPTPRGTAAWRRAIREALVGSVWRGMAGPRVDVATLGSRAPGYHVHGRALTGVLCWPRALYREPPRPHAAVRMIAIQPDSPTPLVSQIVDGLRRLIAEQVLSPGAKLPSIRAFAASHAVSVFTVVEAYDRLVAQGWLVSRANAGFFVRRRPRDANPAPQRPSADLSFDGSWYLQQIFESAGLALKAGCGWLPSSWLFEEGVRRSLRQLAADGAELGGYGLPQGHLALRLLVAENLAERQIAAGASNVLLAQGSSQALDLIARRLVQPGDAVLVDDPGYPNLMFMLRILGARLVGVPRTPDGYDLAA